jgi:hypothetical protein
MNTVKRMSFLTNCGDRMSADTPPLTNPADDDRDAVEAILGHIARYRLATFATLARMPEFTHDSPGRLRRLLRQCREDEWISSAVLHSGMRYWFLRKLGANRCSLENCRSGPLSETAKIRAYALLSFCCLSDTPRHRLRANELNLGSGGLHRPGMPGTYYFDPAESGRLGLARVDAGQCGRWDRIVQSVREDIRQHQLQPGFRQLTEAHRFEISVLTVLPAKAERIVDALNSCPEANQIPVRVVAQPELLPLVHSSPGKEVQARRSTGRRSRSSARKS